MNVDVKYVKNLEAENEKLREMNETLMTSYEAMEEFFLLSSSTNVTGVVKYSLLVKKSNILEITQRQYDILSKIGIEAEPHVDMRAKYSDVLDYKELQKIIDEGYGELQKFNDHA
jgi:hypothetical protein